MAQKAWLAVLLALLVWAGVIAAAVFIFDQAGGRAQKAAEGAPSPDTGN